MMQVYARKENRTLMPFARRGILRTVATVLRGIGLRNSHRQAAVAIRNGQGRNGASKSNPLSYPLLTRLLGALLFRLGYWAGKIESRSWT